MNEPDQQPAANQAVLDTAEAIVNVLQLHHLTGDQVQATLCRVAQILADTAAVVDAANGVPLKG